MNCQYYDNNFETCTNGDCPFCSDFCPVTENQEICRYSGLDETEIMLRNCLDNEERESRETIQALAEENQELKKYQELGDYDRLRELAQADRDGRCVVLPAGGFSDQDGENALKSAMNTCYYHNNPVTRFIADAVAEKLVRAEAALKEREKE
ncbi:MAG TPA: hypothetical protein IAB55_06525 [Candidatus Merdivicinus faecavium]|nr:hypothetical protein [Candidatus Merdivicinus faecavium]